MTEQQQEMQNELLTRFELVEAMVQEGRRSTRYWGWTPVLWGVAYLIAIRWSTSSVRPQLAWPVMMIVAALITIIVARGRKREIHQTTLSRALSAVWAAMGIAIFLYCFSAGISGHFELHSGLAAVEAFLGLANFASALILRWRVQGIVALLWWVASVATCFVAGDLVMPILVAITLVGMIGFGLYLMYCERRDRRMMAQHG